ncbi:MAG: ribonuclease HII [Candidatus Buchananbacteria bacterium]|nr:ribonuclease HII [Candidatus Buchananbacteria bacterium]
MFYPNKSQEKRLVKKGFQLIAGIDEAGRGAWAGPIVAAAVIMPLDNKIKGIKDSKLLRLPERKSLYKKITESALAWGVGIVDYDVIDKDGLTRANFLAMELAVKSIKPLPDYLLIDGRNLKIADLSSSGIIDGDYKVFSIAAASIVAKVTRDNLMDELDEKYPAYGFKQHKGYGTNQHFQMLMQYGVSKIHRRSYKPIKDLLEG